VGVFFGELRQRGPYMIAAEAGAGGNPEQAFRRAFGGKDHFGHLVDIFEDALRPFIDGRPVIGDRDAAGGPVQQFGFQRPFEDGYSFADISGGYAQLGGGRHEAAIARNKAEQA